MLEKLRVGEWAVIGGIAIFFVLVQAIALLLVQPLQGYGLDNAFGDPESVWNPIYYLALLLLFTGALLVIMKYGANWLIKAIMGVAVLSTLVYVFVGLIGLAAPGLGLWAALVPATALAVGLTALLIAHQEWYVIDAVGILVAAGAGSLFGVSLAILPTVLLLVLLAVYDYISVYKTKHMIRLAEGIVDLKLPIMFVMPRRWGYSYRGARGLKSDDGEKEAYFMGLGDAVMPTMLAVSANAFLPGLPRLLGFVNVPALGAILGTLASYGALMYIVVALKKPQAGLPFLCTGAILGFLAGCLAAGVF